MILEGFFSILSNILILTARLEGRNTFPHPLSSEKEQEYLAKFLAGDMEARDILIKHNLRLVAYIAKKYTNFPDPDDLISVGTIGLIKAINTFKPEKGVQLATYASRCIENEILMTMRSYKRQGNVISLNEPIGTDKEGNVKPLGDTLAIDGPDMFEGLDAQLRYDNLMFLIDKYLDKRERQIVLLRYGLKDLHIYTQQQVAEKLGISRSYVSRIEKKAILKLRFASEKEKIEF